MHTNWIMTAFLVLGLISASALLYTALKIIDNSLKERRPASALITVFAGALSVIIIALKVNNPTNLITILAKPSTGLSGAVISQIVMFAAGVIVYLKNPRGRVASVVLACLFMYSVFCLNRLYMISTRSALNTYLLTLVFASAALLAICSFTEYKTKSGAAINLGISTAGALIMILFFVRMAFLSSPDRVISIDMLLRGELAPVFWAFILFGVFVPLTSAIIRFFKIYTIPPIILVTSAVIAIVLLSIIINEMPASLGAVQGRMLF